MQEWKILQIVPAQSGWKAIYCQEAENRQVRISSHAVICWALVEPIGAENVARTEVRGVVQGLGQLMVVGDLMIKTNKREESVEGNQYFLGYNDPEAHKESDYWIKQGSARLKTQNDQTLKQSNGPRASLADASQHDHDPAI